MRNQCIGHVDEGARSKYIEDWATGRGDLVLDHLQVKPELPDQIFLAATTARGARELTNCSFVSSRLADGCRFNDARLESVNFLRATFIHADFRNANFSSDAEFTSCKFEGRAQFMNATFGSRAKFGVVRFAEEADFGGATFGDAATFWKTQWNGDASFGNTKFGPNATFTFCRFGAKATFSGARLGEEADFSRSTFSGPVDFTAGSFGIAVQFSNTEFQGSARFRRRLFGRGASFNKSRFEGDTSFEFASFEDGDVAFTDAEVRSELFSLDGITFSRPVYINVKSNSVSLRGARFLNGGHIRLEGDATVDLEDASFPQPFMISGKEGSRASVSSVRRADLAGLVISELSLTDCRFVGAHNLDKLQIQSLVRPFQFFGVGPWGTRRMVILEEIEWRNSRANAASPSVSAEQVASIYRQLRKGREDRKDEPGAADFYYGEMLMRMRSTHSSRAERMIISVYWAASGFGLRASRAFAAFLALLLVAGIAISLWGLRGGSPRGVSSTMATGFLAAMKGSVGWQSPDTLNVLGEYINLGLRIAGPVLLGLGALAIRGRIKRG
ncbi:hypothetical protein GCM10009557_01290 [Virgisporangium ochraceum]|uniref:Pentapeptide repeat-containing protein n=2 Tax=Virgisporangium ochraceum TaxID=65505 RepID=A0A8J4A5F3_9ACTN|nr:hypothetical protein Voc01_090770 [Virgisporangium ochraceum]